MTPEERAALRELHAKATPGPWTARGREVCWERGTIAPSFADAAFIAAAREAVPALLDELDRVEKALRIIESANVRLARQRDTFKDDTVAAERKRHDVEQRATRAERALEKATIILRSILATDERGQGVLFAEAMNNAKSFVRALEGENEPKT